MGGILTRTWTAADRQRAEIIPESGSEMGQFMALGIGSREVTITRPDLGVELTLNPDRKTYIETPIAIPYTTPAPQGTNATEPASLPSDDEPSAEIEFKKAAEQKTFAGLQADGYETWTEGRKSVTAWMTRAQGELAELQAVLAGYKKIETAARLAQFPESERTALDAPDPTAQPMADAAWTAMARMMKDMQDGVLLAIENHDSGPTGGAEDQPAMTGYVMEVLKVERAAADPSRYEIPEGYTKISQQQADAEMAREVMRKMMGEGGALPPGAPGESGGENMPSMEEFMKLFQDQAPAPSE